MKVVGIDLGTRCGWAVGSPAPSQAGEWDLRTSKWESPGMLFVKFEKSFSDLLTATEAELIVYESVPFVHRAGHARVIHGLTACLQKVSAVAEVNCHGINVSTLKKHFTGRGNAKKDDMRAAFRKRMPELNVPGADRLGEDAIDAIALVDYAWRFVVPTLMPMEL